MNFVRGLLLRTNVIKILIINFFFQSLKKYIDQFSEIIFKQISI